MSKKRMEFPMLVQVGSVAVRIYKVNNRGHQRYTLSYFADGKRRLKTCSSSAMFCTIPSTPTIEPT